MKATPSQQMPSGGSDHRLVRALRRCKQDGWPRCPKCGKRMRPYMGNMRDPGTAGPQNWQCDAHFMPSYYGTAQGVIDKFCSPNVPAHTQKGRERGPDNTQD